MGSQSQTRLSDFTFTSLSLMHVKIWRQPKCPSRDERIKKMWGACLYFKIECRLWQRKKGKVSCSVVSDSLQPMDCSPPDSFVYGILHKNTGVGCHSLLQGIFLTQGLNLGLPHCRQILYQVSHQESTDWNSVFWFLNHVFGLRHHTEYPPNIDINQN